MRRFLTSIDLSQHIEEFWQAVRDSLNPPKRRPLVKVRRIWRDPNPITGRTFSTWYWQCNLCDHNLNPREAGGTNYGELCFTWTDAYRRADRHARDHHRSAGA